MTHYHVMVGPMTGVMPSNLRFDSYEESVAMYVRLSRDLFEGRYEQDEVTIEKVVMHTSETDEGIYMGIPTLAVLWVPCDTAPCASPAWN